MIKHYFCEYCGKDFLSEDECAKHEVNCEERLKELEKRKEAERQADLEEIAYCFNELIELCADYIEEYGISDLDKFKKTLESKLLLIDKKFDNKGPFEKKTISKPLSFFEPCEFTFEDTKYNDEALNKMLGVDKLHPFGSMIFRVVKNDENNDKDNKSKKDEIDNIIDKLSDTPEVKPNYVTTTDITDKDFKEALEKILLTLDGYNSGTRTDL